MPDKNLTNLDVSQFISDWNSGLSLIDLAEKYGFSYPEKAKRIAAQLGLKETERHRSRYHNVDATEFTMMYLDKKIPVRVIQRKFHFADAGYVSNFAKKLGLPLREGGYSNKFETYKDQFCKMWGEGRKIREIKNELGISELTVHFWRKKLNLPKRMGSRRFEEKRNVLTKKIVEYLLKNYGALTTSELLDKLEIRKEYLKKLLRSDKFDSLPLVIGHSAASKTKTTDCFGDYTNTKIIFLKDNYDSLILKLAEIISNSRIILKRQLDSSKLTFIVKNLAVNHKVLLDRQYELHGAIYYNEKREELRNKIKKSLEKYSVTTIQDSKQFDNLEQKSDYYQIVQLLKNSKEIIFYGRKVEKKRFLDELYNSDLELQTHLLRKLFCALNFSSTFSDNTTFHDFQIVSEVKYLVKIMIYQTVTKTDIDIFFSQLRNDDKGIIITFSEVDGDLSNLHKNNIIIITRPLLENILENIKYLPSETGNIVRIMYGENKGKFGFISEINYESNEAIVTELLQKNIIKVPIGSLKEIFDESKLKSIREKFTNFLFEISKVCDTETIANLDTNIALEISDDSYSTRKYERCILAKVNEQTVSLVLSTNHQYIGDLNHLDGIDHCRYNLISCDCLAWLDQYQNINLCNHITNLLFYLWQRNLNENKDQFYYNILDYIKEIHFLIRTSPMIENFWHDYVEDKFLKNERRKELYHKILCKVIKYVHNMDDFATLKLKIKPLEINHNSSESELDTLLIDIRKDLQNSKTMNYIFLLKNEQRERVIETLQLYFDELIR